MSAMSPAMMAGPRLRAGFTDAPVTGTAAKWMATRVNEIATGAALLLSAVVRRMTITKMAVRMASRRNTSIPSRLDTVRVPDTADSLDA